MREYLTRSVLAAALLISGCATTMLTSTWRDPSFQPNSPKKAAVIAVIKNTTGRRKVEDTFVNELMKKGITGVPSYTFLQDQKMEKDKILEEVNKIGADLIIVTSVVDRKKSETYVPPTTTATRSLDTGFYGYYSTWWESVYTPGYTVTAEDAISEIKAFDAKEQKLVWSATAKTAIDEGVTESIIEEFCKKVTESLLKGRDEKKG